MKSLPDVALVVALCPHETLLGQYNFLLRFVSVTWPPHIDDDRTLLQSWHLVSHAIPELSELRKWGKSHPHPEVLKETLVIVQVLLMHVVIPK